MTGCDAFAPDGLVITIKYICWIAEGLPICFQSRLSVHYCAPSFSLSLEQSKMPEMKRRRKDLCKSCVVRESTGQQWRVQVCSCFDCVTLDVVNGLEPEFNVTL